MDNWLVLYNIIWIVVRYMYALHTAGNLRERQDMNTPNLMQAEMLAIAMAVHINTDGRMSVSRHIKPMAVARSWGLTGRSMYDVLPTLVVAIQDARELEGMEPWRCEPVERALSK